MVPLRRLRQALLAVHNQAAALDALCLNQWALPLEDGRSVMSLESVEDALRALRGAVNAALLEAGVAVTLGEPEDAEFWDRVREVSVEGSRVLDGERNAAA